MARVKMHSDWKLFANEREFQETVVGTCRTFGLLCYHTYDSRRSAPGFPDLVIVGKNRTLFVELKTDTTQLTLDQIMWRDRLLATGELWELWRPRMWRNRHIQSDLIRLREGTLQSVG